MPYKQVTLPNLNKSATPGYCLMYVDDAVDAPLRSKTAQKAFDNEKKNGNIRAESLPEGLWVPIFFSLNVGEFAGLGHVAWACNHGDYVEIHDSEVHSGSRGQYGVYTSIAQLMSWFSNLGIVYLGWSTWIDGVKVVEEYDNKPKPEVAKFLPLEDGERVMVASTGLHKFDPDKKQFSDDITLAQADFRLFVDKVIVDGKTYLRTELDRDNNVRRGFDFAKLIPLYDPSEVYKRLKKL